MLNTKTMTRLSAILFTISSVGVGASSFAASTPSINQATVFSLDCSYSTSGKKAPATCQVVGSVCLDGDENCITPKSTINSVLNVTCSDGFTLVDQAATRSVNGTILSMQGKDTSMNSVAIDFDNFNNKAETLSSSILITDAYGSSVSMSGSCILQ